MKARLVTIVLLAAAVLTIAGDRSASTVQKKSLPFNNRIEWYANEAKAKGQNRIAVSGFLADEYPGGAGTISAEEAFSSSTVVVAHLVFKESSYRNNEIFTWNKFAIDEILSEAKEVPGRGFLMPVPPSTILPVQSGEFLIPKRGGKVNIDGVDVEQVVESFPAYELNQKYVLLIHLYPSGVAHTFGGPIGVFRVLEDDKLVPIGESEHRTRRDFKDLYGNSLETLRTHFKQAASASTTMRTPSRARRSLEQNSGTSTVRRFS